MTKVILMTPMDAEYVEMNSEISAMIDELVDKAVEKEY